MNLYAMTKPMVNGNHPCVFFVFVEAAELEEAWRKLAAWANTTYEKAQEEYTFHSKNMTQKQREAIPSTRRTLL